VLPPFDVVRHLLDSIQIVNKLANCSRLFGFGEGDVGFSDVCQSAFHVCAGSAAKTVHVQPGA
jgi:hypothetical protein